MACGERVRTEVRYVRNEAPDYLFSCAAAPEPPPRPRTQRSVTEWMGKVLAAHGDCYGKVKTLGVIFNSNGGGGP